MVPRTPGENTVQIMRGRGEQIREKAVCGFQAYKAIPPPTPRWGSSKRTKPEVPICWVLFNRWASAWRVYPKHTGAAASKQNYLRMVTYFFFPHAWRRLFVFPLPELVFWCRRIERRPRVLYHLGRGGFRGLHCLLCKSLHSHQNRLRRCTWNFIKADLTLEASAGFIRRTLKFSWLFFFFLQVAFFVVAVLSTERLCVAMCRFS